MDRLRAAISARVIGRRPLRLHDRLRPANAVVLAVALVLTATVAGPTSAAAEPDGPVSIGVPTTDGLIAGLGDARVPVTLDAELEDGEYSVQVRVAPGTGTLRIPEDSTVTPAGSLPTGTSTAASSIAFAGELADLRAALEDLHFTPADPAAPAPTELRVDVAATIPTDGGRDLFYNPANGHVYEYVDHGGAISWEAARTAAAGLTYDGLDGHLATITTADEAAFVADVIDEPNTWIGASDDAFVVGEARGAPVFRITHVERPRRIFTQSWDLILTLDRPHPYSNATDFAIWSSVIFDGLDVPPFDIADRPNPIVLQESVPGTDRLTLFIVSTTAPRTEVTGDARLTGRVGLGGTLGILRTEGDWYWVDGPEAGQRVADGHTAWASGQPTTPSSGTAVAVTSDGWKNLAKDDTSITGYLVEYSGSVDLPTFSGSRWIVPHAPSRLRTSAPTDGFDVRLAWNATAGSGSDPAIRYEYAIDGGAWQPVEGGADARAVQFDLDGVADACNGNVLVRAAIGPFASPGVLTSSGPLCPTPSIAVAAPTEVAGSPGVFAVPITPSDFDPSQNYAAFVDVPAGDATLALTVTSGLSPAFDFATGTFLRIDGDGNELGFIGTYAQVTAALESVRVTQVLTPGAGIRVNATLTTAPPEDEGGSSFYYFPENGHYYEYVDTGAKITWTKARDDAAKKTLFGMEGYLVTITSLSESRFVHTQIEAPNIWMGASDDFEVVNAARGDNFYTSQRDAPTPSEGRWYWVTGPEAGQKFWELSDPTDFSSQERRDVNGGQAVDGAFSAWCDNEPNNREGMESVADRVEHYGAANYACGSGTTDVTQNWNDFIVGGDPEAYLVEYGGMPDDESTVQSAVDSRVLGARPVVFDADVVIVDGETESSSPRGIDWDVVDGKLVTYETDDGEVRISAEDLQAALDDPDNRLTTIKADTFTGGPDISITGPLTLDLANDSSYSGGISGDGSLIKRGPGGLVLEGNNTYSGGTTVEGGTLSAPEDTGTEPFGTGPIVVDDGATVDDGGRGLTSIRTIVPDPDVTIYDSNNPANDGLTEGIKGQDWDVIDGKLVVYTDPVAIPSDELQALIDDGTLTTIEAGTLDGDGPIVIPPGTDLTFDVSGDSSYDGNLSGGGGLIKKGDGDLTLGGANSYSGGTTIAEGELTAGFDYSDEPLGPGPFRAIIADPDVTIFDPENAPEGVTPGSRGQDWDVIDGKLVVYTDPVAIPSDELQALIDDGTLTTIEAGTLDGDGPLEIPDGRTLTFDVSEASEYNGDLTGPGGIIKKGDGDLTLGGDNTYSGGTTVADGDLIAGADGAFGTGPVNELPGGTVNKDEKVVDNTVTTRTPQTDPAVTIFDPENAPEGVTPGSRGQDWDVIDGKLIVYTDPVAIPSDELQALIDGGELHTIEAGTLDGDGPLEIPDGRTLTLDVSGESSYDGNLSGDGGLIKRGAGDLTLGGDNTYSGGTTVADGDLIAGADGAFGTGPIGLIRPGDGKVVVDPEEFTVLNDERLVHPDANIVVVPDATDPAAIRGDDYDIIDGRLITYRDPLNIRREDLQAALDDPTNPLTIIEGGTFSGNQPLVIPEGTDLVIDVSDETSDSTYTGNLSGGGGIIKKGAGDLELLGINTYEGGTTVLDGRIDANLFPVSPFGLGPVNVLPGAELDDGGFETLSLINPPRGPVTDADIEVVEDGGTPRGDGWDVIDGKLVIFETDADGKVRIDGAVLQAALDDAANPLTTIEANTFSGDQPLNIPNGTTLLLDLDGDSTYSGDLSGGGGIEKSGDGDLLLEGDNTYSGGTLLSEGTLTAGSDSVLVPGQPQTGPFGTGPVNVMPGAEVVVPEDFTVRNAVVDVITRADLEIVEDGGSERGVGWDVIGGRLVVYDDPIAIDAADLQEALTDPDAPLTVIEARTLSGDQPLVLPDGRTLTLDLTEASEYSGELSGSGGLAKAGPGTLLLSGENTYSGGTTIEEGTLAAGSSSSEDGTTGPFGTGTITVDLGGTLDTADRTVSNEVVVIVAEVPGTGGGTTDTTSGGSSSGPSIALGCTDDRRIGEVVTCTVTGGPADHEMLWEAAYNPVFASGPVLLGADGSGSFSFTVPAEALGELITATLVGWGVSALLGMGGTVGDADTTLIPSRIDAGGGPMPPAPMPSAIMTVLLGTMVAVLQRDRRLVRAGASSEEPLEPDPDPDPEPEPYPGLDRLAVLAEELRIAYEAVERGD